MMMLRISIAVAALAAVSLAPAQHAGAQASPVAGAGAETPAAVETPPATDPAIAALDAEKARLDKQAEVLRSRKALAEAQAQAAQSAIGPLGSYTGAPGAVSVDDGNRSVVEATLLSAVAVDAAGDQMGARLCGILSGADCTSPGFAGHPAGPPSPRVNLPPPEQMSRPALCREVRSITPPAPPLSQADRAVIIVAQSTTSLTELADSFMVRTTALGREFCAALEAPSRPAAADGEVSGGSLAAAGAIINTVANLFRADYTIYGIAVPTDQTLLTKGVALAFMSHRLPNRVYMPDLSPVSSLDTDNPAVRRLAVLDALRAMAADSRVAAARTRLDAAMKAYDDALAVLTTATEGKPPLLTAVVRQAGTAELLRAGGLLVITNIHMMGGTSYTTKNFFTFLGGMPYFVSGGALASYVVQDGLGGPVLDTLTVPITSGFHRANQLERVVPSVGRRGR